MKSINITLPITENQEHALQKLLPYWKEYTTPDNIKPFENYKVRDLLEYLMQFGIEYHIDKLIKREQEMQEKHNWDIKNEMY